MEKLSKAQMLTTMLSLVATRHAGQYDRGGKPYVLHVLKVMHYTKSDDVEIQCIALGHDLIEDTFKSVEDGTQALVNHGFSDRVIAGIVALTKLDGEDYEDYKSRVKSNADAIVVKMADLRHNSDIRRLKGVTEKDIRRIEKYHRFYLELQNMG